MSSATGLPDENTVTHGRGEDEPLLGRAGDASQQDGKGIQYNFVLGLITFPSWLRTWTDLLCRDCCDCTSWDMDCMISKSDHFLVH